MGLFKGVKKMVKSAIKHPLATVAGLGLSAALGPAGFGVMGTLGAAGVGSAASMLLSGGAKGKQKAPSPAAVPASPMAALPEFAAFDTRPQTALQTAEGGDVASADLLGDDGVEDEVKKRRASRLLLG